MSAVTAGTAFAVEPSGPRPKRRFAPATIMIYTALIFAAIYYLIPLYVMVVTSLKGLEEVRLGNIFAPPLEITFEPWVKAWNYACTGLYCEGLKVGFLQLGLHHRPERHRFDRRRLGQRLRARQLALQGVGILLHRPPGRLLHPLPGLALSAGASSPRSWASTARSGP